ncbi:MAG TPA: hypothetical protein VEA81_14675 [Burkholderiaceae bacterium]|nr:hypothetical protein [Burkholderiaceae bacterium]
MPVFRIVAAAAAPLVVSYPAPAPAQGTAASSAAVASVDPGRGAELDRLRSLAWRDLAGAQLELAMRLAEAHRLGAADSAIVEAAYWAGRSWDGPNPVTPNAIAAFVRRHCGTPAISRHWVCTEGE